MIEFDHIQYHLTGTWPSYDELRKDSNSAISNFMKKIYIDGVLTEINRLLTSKEYPNCNGIGHIALIAICSAIDSVSAFANGGGKVGARFTSFIARFFPKKYYGKEKMIYDSFRCDSVHGWNLHKCLITGIPGDPLHLSEQDGIPRLSLYDLFNDLTKAMQSYCEQLKVDDDLKHKFLRRYKKLKRL